MMQNAQSILHNYINWVIGLLCLSGIILATAGCTTPQADTLRPYRIGFLSGANVLDRVLDGFRAGMTEFGYVEGETIQYDFQSADGNHEQMRLLAEQLVASEVDLIVTTTTVATLAVKSATEKSQIPVVFTYVGDPIDSGVVTDLRQPRGNITGVTRSVAGTIGKRMAFLHEIMPDLKGIWVPYEENYATTELTLQAIHEVADPLEIAILETPVGSSIELLAELDRFALLSDVDFDTIYISPNPVVQSDESMAAIMNFAEERKLPVVADTAAQVRNGALMTYADDILHTGQLVASLADQILQGTAPGQLPVVYSDPILYLNYQTAQTLGLAIDASILAQAREIIR